MNDMRVNGRRIPAQVQPPRREALNQVALRSGKELKASFDSNSNSGTGVTSEQRNGMLSATYCPSQGIVQVEDTEDGDEEIDKHIVIPPSEPTLIPLSPEANLSCVKKKVNVPCMEALELPKASKIIKYCITGESKRDGKILVGENVSAIVQNHLPSKCKDPDFLENEFSQDEYPALSTEEKAELEAFSKSDLFNTQGLSDEEIEAAIMGWCMKREHMGSTESCKLPNPEDLTSQCKLPIPEAEKELLLSAIQPPESELKPLPANMKHAYLKENDTLPVIINGDLKRSQ